MPSLLVLASLLALLSSPAAYCACVCGTGKMINWFPGTAPVSIDGNMADWTNIMSSPNNNICDGSPGSGISELDGSIQSTGRDLMQFTYTFDSNYVYAYTQRYASSTNTDNFIYYADTNNNGVMETGEPVVVVGWQGSNRNVSVYIGSYQAVAAGGDPMVCPAGSTSCTPGFADGYHLPGSVINLPSPGRANYSGTWGSTAGTEMEWRVSWADLGLASSPGTPFTFHVSSTNSQPGAGSFPAQIDDNMGGCGGKGGTTQYAGVAVAPDATITLTSATSYSAIHTLTNTGNGNDNFTLSTAIAGSNNPIPTVTYYYNGQAFTDTSTLGSGFSIAAGAHITFTAQYSFPTSPATKSYTVTTTAKSKFDSTVSGQGVDTLTSQEAVTISNNTVGGYGSFSYSGGTNGLPASLTLISSAGNDPVVSPGYVINPAQSASITQNMPPGWIFGSGSCSYVTSGTAVSSSNYTFTNNGSSVVLNLSKAAFTGDNVNCTFTNQKLPTITVNKLLGANRVSDSDQFTIQLASGGTVLASSGTSGTGEQILPGTGSVSYTPAGTGVNYRLQESMASGSPTPGTVYGASVYCTNNSVAVATPSALGQDFTPTIGDNYICWIVNTPPTVKVQAQSAPYTGVFGYSGNNGIAASFSLDTSTVNPAGQTFVLSSINTQTTVTQTSAATGWRLASATCVDGSSNTVPNTTLSSGTLTIPPVAIVAGAKLTCTFVDNFYFPQLIISQVADKGAAQPGEVVTYSSTVTNYAGIAANVTLSDKVSPYSAFGLDSYGAGIRFRFQDGTSPSGVTLGVPLYSKDHGANWDYVPTSGGGGAPSGYDANVTDWKIPLNGNINDWQGGSSPYPSFNVSYKVITR